MHPSNKIIEFIKNDSIKRSHEESCGLIFRDNKGEIKIISCLNDSKTPRKSFEISESIIDEYAKNNQIVGYYHSHIHENANELSWIDKVMSEQTKLTSILYDLITGEIHVYKPCGWVAPLLNRPYMTGFFDSYTIIKDFYKQMLDLNNNFCYTRYIKCLNTLSEKNQNALHKILDKQGFYLIPFIKNKCIVILNKDGADKEFGVFDKGNILTHFYNTHSNYYMIEELNKLGYTFRFYFHDDIN